MLKATNIPKSDKQLSALKNKLNKIIESFEKENNVTICGMQKLQYLPQKLEEIVELGAIRVLNIERASKAANGAPPTTDKVYSDILDGLGMLPINKQNEVLANVIREAKKQRTSRSINTLKDLELSQSIHDTACKNQKSFDAILGGALDELNF